MYTTLFPRHEPTCVTLTSAAYTRLVCLARVIWNRSLAVVPKQLRMSRRRETSRAGPRRARARLCCLSLQPQFLHHRGLTAALSPLAVRSRGALWGGALRLPLLEEEREEGDSKGERS